MDMTELEAMIAAKLTQTPDPYREAAAKLYGIPVEQVTADQRRAAKEIAMYSRYSGDKA